MDARELRHSFVSVLSAHDVGLEDVSDLVGHSSTSVIERVYLARAVETVYPARAHERRDGHELDSSGQGHAVRVAPARGKPRFRWLRRSERGARKPLWPVGTGDLYPLPLGPPSAAQQIGGPRPGVQP
jgi:hypothetical protein